MNLKNIIPWKKSDSQMTRRHEESDPFFQLQRRMDHLFEDILGPSFGGWRGLGTSRFAPRIDISETDKEVRISAELPGIDEKDLEVTVSGDLLTIKGEKKEEHEEEKGEFFHSERSYGFFERSLALPKGLDADKAKAKFNHGVLKVVVPKKPEAVSHRKKIELMDS